ncbi:MAG: TonB-dependent receptor [bacterium]
MSCASRVVLACGILLVPCAVLRAQSGTGTVVGQVSGSDHRSLAGAAVWIDSTPIFATTNDEGRYRLQRIPAGRHVLITRFIGYEAAKQEITVAADNTLAKDFVLSEVAHTLGAVKIEGQRDAQARALTRQQNADIVSNVVSADVIGRTPDVNTAEALQRLPGVSVQRDQGEGRFFQIRGTPPEYSSVSLNGVRLPAPDRSTRAVALDAVMPEVLGSIVLSKTLTPDMDADAIGGSVNLITKAAEEGRVTQNLTIARGYDQLTKGAIGNYSGMYGRRFGDGEKLGLLLGASYQTTDRGSNDYETDWGPTKVGAQTIQAPTNFEPRDYLLTRTRQSYVGTLDYKLSSTTNFSLRSNVDNFSDSEDRWRTRFRPGTIQPGDSATASRIERTLRHRKLDDYLQNYTLRAEHTASNYAVDATAGWSRARETNPYREEVTFRQSNATIQYNVADPYNPVLSLSKGNLDQANLYSFNALTQDFRDGTDRDLSGRVNITVPFQPGSLIGSLKFGAAFRGKLKNSTEADVVTTKFPVALTLDSVMGNRVNTNYRFGPAYFAHSNVDEGLLDGLIARYNSTRTIDTAAAHLTRDPNLFRATENVSAGYAMAIMDLGALRVIPGVRVEATSIGSDGFTVNTKNGVWTSSTPSSTNGSYTNVLPSVNVRYQLSSSANLRAAVVRSLSRPIYDNIRSYALPDVQSLTVTLGNPALHAAQATNYDLMAEQFLSGIGVLSIGYFEKDITDFIAPVQFTATSGTYAGYIVSQPQQGGSATIRGAEVDWQQQFTFLPGYLSGLGLNANYTITHSTAHVPSQNRTADFVGLVPRTGNVAGFYEYGRLQARLAWNFKANFLDTYGTDATTDLFTKAANELDFSGNVKLTGGARLFFEALNLTNQPLDRYKGTVNQPIQQEYYRSWFTTGVRWVP